MRLLRFAPTQMIRPTMFLGAGLLLLQCNRAVEIPELLLLGGGSERPVVVSSSPSLDSRLLSPGGGIFVEFDRAMHEERTAAAFSLSGTDSPSGKTRWSGNRLSYEPDRSLTVGGSYLLRITRGALSREGVSLDPEFLIHFVHGAPGTGGPRIVETVPSDNAQSAATATIIRVQFDRAMDRPATEKAFRVSPAVDGAFLWDAESTLLSFVPRVALQSGSSYSVSLSSTAQDASGVLLLSSYSFSFRAGSDFASPEVTAFSALGVPGELLDGSAGVNKDSSFLIEFSEPMQHAATESAVSLVRVDTGALVSSALGWNGTFTRLTLTPNTPLEPQHTYRAEVSTAAEDQSRNALAAPLRRTFRVDSAAGMLRSDYLFISEVVKDLPLPIESVGTSPTAFSSLQLPASAGALGDLMRLRIRFPLPLMRGSLPSNITLRKLTGTGSAGSLTGLSFAPYAGQNDRELVLEFEGIGNNDYELRLSGGRSGIRSTSAPGESPTFLKGDLNLYLRVGP